jgi:cytochrome subunit of sulfide dehydrogenase
MRTEDMRRIALCSFALGLLLPIAALAVDAKLIESCEGCHGHNGVTPSQEVPTIAGISQPVQLDALNAFKAMKRPCAKVTVRSGTSELSGNMCEIAAKLSSGEIQELAAYYSKLPYVAMKQSVNAGEAAAGAAVDKRDCSICHTEGGTVASDDAGLLGGQPIGWLKSVLAEAKAGTLPQSHIMREKTERLSEADVTALAAYYAGR